MTKPINETREWWIKYFAACREIRTGMGKLEELKSSAPNPGLFEDTIDRVDSAYNEELCHYEDETYPLAGG